VASHLGNLQHAPPLFLQPIIPFGGICGKVPEESGLVKPSSRDYLARLTLITPLGMLSGSVESLVRPIYLPSL
jgi:hypothetical protein